MTTQPHPESGFALAEGPTIIGGPCSAETEDQVVETARQLAATGRVHLFRAGIWKPRTRPGEYEGAGEAGLAWLVRARQETGLPVSTEVANREHVEAALRHGVDVLWIGARTSVNPFSVQEIADALRGVDVPVLVKNPVNPDLELWIGALERLSRAGLRRLGAIHRGFSAFQKGAFRNVPMWEIPIELKTRMAGIPLLCDPSHICGNRELIPLVAQKALDLGMNGLMIESHIHPDAAWSDARQQLTPMALDTLLGELVVRAPGGGDPGFRDVLGTLRREIDQLDEEIVQKLAARMKIAEKIGRYKRENSVTILQVDRWEEIVRSRLAAGRAMGVDTGFLRDLLTLIHHESIQVQTRVMNDGSQRV